VLFSEPKIPQTQRCGERGARVGAFQCSSASRKFLKRVPQRLRCSHSQVSVLFSEPKIPQM